MKGEEKYSSLEELFREKLGEAEVTPSMSFGSSVMRAVGRKEFMRFNPNRFNIYYLAGVTAVAVVSLLLVFNGPGSSKETQDQEKNKVSVPSGFNNVLSDKNLDKTKVQAENSGTIETPAKSNNVVRKQGETESQVTATNESQQRIKTIDSSSVIKESKGIFTTNQSDAKLQVKPVASFLANTTAGCAPLRLTFRNTSEGSLSFRWNFGDGTYSDEKNPVKIFTEEGDYNLVLTVKGSDGSVSSNSVTVHVFPAPVAAFSFNPERPIIPEDAIRFMNYSKDAVSFVWKFGDGTTAESFEPEHRYAKYASYDVTLIAKSDKGCSDTAVMVNAFSGSGTFINFPNAFIPNPDGPSGGNYSNKSDEAAQVFHPVSSGVSEYELKVFSKLGILLFETRDINTGWDGYHKGQLCEPGVYVWKSRGKFRNGEPFIKAGDVTLIKQ